MTCADYWQSEALDDSRRPLRPDRGYTWCARIHGDDLRNVVHADTAEHLDEHIRLREEDLAADAGSPRTPAAT